MNNSTNIHPIEMIEVTNEEKSILTQKSSLEIEIHQMLDDYFELLGEEKASNVYQMVIDESEKATLTYVLKRTQGNQSQAAHILGINRNTLRTKMKRYDLLDFNFSSLN